MRKVLKVAWMLPVALALFVPASAVGKSHIAFSAAQVGRARQIMAEPASARTPLTGSDLTLMEQLGNESTTTTTKTGGPSLTPEPTMTGTAMTASLRGKKVMAHAADTCWGPLGETVNRGVPILGTIATAHVSISQWCGNGQAITAVNGWYQYGQGYWPYCITPAPPYEYHGGEGAWYGGHSTWIHGITHDVVGVTYPYGCLPLVNPNTDAVLRAAYNGYYDFYNDFGI